MPDTQGVLPRHIPRDEMMGTEDACPLVVGIEDEIDQNPCAVAVGIRVAYGTGAKPGY